MLAEVLELVGGVERVAGPLGQENLPSAPSLGNPGSAMNVKAEVGVVTDVRLAGVHPHAHADLDAFGPGVAGERLLRGDGCRGSRPSVLEDDEELVAPVIDDVSASLFHGSAEKLAVVGQNLGVPIPQALKELRRSFDVGEEEGDGSIGKGRHLRLLQWNLGTNSGARSRRALDRKLAIQ